MAYSRSRSRGSGSADYWPGFVDAMATLLLVMTFLLSVFMLANFFRDARSQWQGHRLASVSPGKSPNSQNYLLLNRT